MPERITLSGESTRLTDTSAELVVDSRRGGSVQLRVTTIGNRGGRHTLGIVVSAEQREAILRLLDPASARPSTVTREEAWQIVAGLLASDVPTDDVLDALIVAGMLHLAAEEEGDQPAAEEASGPVEYRVTFGSQYAHEPHPRWAAAHPDGWLTVLAADEMTARRALHATIGPHWGGIYHPGDDWYPGSPPATALAGDVDYFPRGELGRLDATDPDHPTGLDTYPPAPASKPIVWAWCNNTFGTSDQAWVAVSDDGQLIAQHISSNREWGQHDVGPAGGHARDYLRVLGSTDVDYRVQPDGDGPPAHVLDRADARRGGEQP